MLQKSFTATGMTVLKKDTKRQKRYTKILTKDLNVVLKQDGTVHWRQRTMDRLDKTIGDVKYILDCLLALRDISRTGNCNECERRRGLGVCDYAPGIGYPARYNCPFFERNSEEKRK